MALIDFTLSNARRFYSSMGNPLGLKGLTGAERGSNKLNLCQILKLKGPSHAMRLHGSISKWIPCIYLPKSRTLKMKKPVLFNRFQLQPKGT